MKTLSAVTLFTCLSSLPLATRAAADESSPPAAMPALPATASVAAPPVAASGPCRLGEHGGVEDADAHTAAQLVCLEISRAGAPADATYRVDVGRLGSLVILTVAREGTAPGSTADVRELKLHGIEEVSAAAPRIAESLVHGTPLDEGEAPQSLTDKRNSSPNAAKTIHFALGLIGQFPPFDQSATPAPGVNLELHSEIDPFEIVGNFRFGADSADTVLGLVFVNFSMGGRYFVSPADTSLYVGGGFAWSYFSITNEASGTFNGSHTGLGAYGELGVEFLRTRHTHLAVGARIDAPFFNLDEDHLVDNTVVVNGVQTTQEVPGPSLYYAPLSIELRLTF
jgi:hypothetical protein